MTYDQFVVSMLPHCRCGCGSSRCADRPCAGVLAGGVCDTMQCHCGEDGRWQDDDEPLGYQDEDNT